MVEESQTLRVAFGATTWVVIHTCEFGLMEAIVCVFFLLKQSTTARAATSTTESVQHLEGTTL